MARHRAIRVIVGFGPIKRHPQTGAAYATGHAGLTHVITQKTSAARNRCAYYPAARSQTIPLLQHCRVASCAAIADNRCMRSSSIPIRDSDIVVVAIRAQGAGGQHVNKVSSAIHLRFDISASDLPELVKSRLLAMRDHRITQEGVIVIKAQARRSQDLNRADARARLQALVDRAAVLPKVRTPTKHTAGARRRRLEAKSSRSQIKQSRGRVGAVD